MAESVMQSAVLDKEEQEQHRALNKLIVQGRHHLRDIEREARRFNVFRVLGIAQQELKHSNMLAWLLDSRGTHGLGDRFLREFLIAAANADDQSTLDPVDVATARFGDVRVFRERLRLDLLVELPNSESEFPWILAIENKVNATQSENQLLGYRTRLEDRYPTSKRLLVFLSKEEEQPEDSGWIAMRYSDLLFSLDTAITSVGDTIADAPGLLLQNYRTILEEDFMSELSKTNSIEEKCRKIYQEYSDALELLFQYRPDALSDLSSALGEIIDDAFDLLTTGGEGEKRVIKGLIEFVPRSWKQMGFERGGESGLVVCSVNLWGKRADVRLSAVGIQDDAWLERVWKLRGPELPFQTITKRKNRPKGWMTFHSQQLLENGRPLAMGPIVEGEEDPQEAAERVNDAVKRLFQTEEFEIAYRKTTELLKELSAE